jgi:hypothetical protein
MRKKDQYPIESTFKLIAMVPNHDLQYVCVLFYKYSINFMLTKIKESLLSSLL